MFSPRHPGRVIAGLALAAELLNAPPVVGAQDTRTGSPAELATIGLRKTPGALTVGSATATPGAVARGVLSVPPGVDAGYDIPVVVISGARPGPTLALIAGLHGTEFGGIVALQRLAMQLDPATIAGRVIIVPLVNLASFERLVPHLNPVDGKNMNRVFPGLTNGTQSERAAHLLTTQVLSRADYVIDYHGGDMDEDQRPYAYWIRTGDTRRDAVTHDLLRAFGIDYIIKFVAQGLTPQTAHCCPLRPRCSGSRRSPWMRGALARIPPTTCGCSLMVR